MFNAEGMARFEEMCKMYLSGTEEVQQIILSFLSKEEKKTFLEGVGLYHLFTDEGFYKKACRTVGEQVYNEANA